MKKRVRIRVGGSVQGVFYRAFARNRAIELGIKGYVRNLQDGSVEAVCEGEETALKKFVEACRKGPLTAKVEELVEDWQDFQAEFDDFRIRH
jgi:acylphosphatase